MRLSVPRRQLRGQVIISRPLCERSKLFWGSHGNAGLMPRSVADAMVGRCYGSFDAFRRGLWQAVATSAYGATFGPDSLACMTRGGAPPVLAEGGQALGQRVRYELHHIVPVARGGEVYDLANLMFVTPRFHLDVLSRPYHRLSRQAGRWAAQPAAPG